MRRFRCSSPPRRRLILHLRQLRIDAGPARSGRGPDRHRRIGEIRIVEGPNADKDQMRTRLCFAEEWRPARWAESPVHPVPTIRDAWIVAGLTRYGERSCAEAGVDGSASGTEILAVPAP